MGWSCLGLVAALWLIGLPVGGSPAWGNGFDLFPESVKTKAKHDPEATEPVTGKIRRWTTVDGGYAEAALESDPADKNVRLKSSEGRIIEIPVWCLSPADREYLIGLGTPVLRLDVGKNQKNVAYNVDRYITKARIHRKSGPCRIPLTAYLYVISENTYAREENRVECTVIKTFMLEEQKELEIVAPPVDLSHNKGTRAWKGYLLVVTDDEGKPIRYLTTHEWLFDLWMKQGGTLGGRISPDSYLENPYKKMRFR